MIITYIAHSGFSVELPSATLLFDYYKGAIPSFPADKPLYVFSSHQHQDHFNPEIFHLAKIYPSIHFILSHDIFTARRKFFKAGVSEADFDRSVFIRAHETRSFSLDDSHVLTVRTLRSTDLGVAFLVECDGKRIYHAGDLNWWLWKGDSRQEAGNMTANFKREIDTLAGLEFDAVFVPLDPRQEENACLGINYFLNTAMPKHVFPMHFWEDYDAITRYLQKYPSHTEQIHIHTINREGQQWNLDGV